MAKSKLSKILVCLFVAVTFLFAQHFTTLSMFSFFGNANNSEIARALDTQDTASHKDVTTNKLSNPNFTLTDSGSSSTSSSSYTGNTTIQTPRNWTKDSSYTTISESLKIGVVDLSPSSYSKNWKNYNLPKDNNIYRDNMNSDSKVLMINSTAKTIFGYKTTSDVSLDANSFYSISVNYYTDSTALASIYLIGTDFDKISSASFSNNSNGNWSTITFWIATSSTKTSSLKIGLYLGAKETSDNIEREYSGNAMFDNLNITQYSKNYFEGNYTTTTNGVQSNRYINLNHSDLTAGDGFIQNGNFANSFEGWSPISNATGSIQLVPGNTTTMPDTTLVKTNERSSEDSVLYLKNEQLSVSGVTSNKFTIKQHAVYRISFWAKGKLSQGTMYAKLSGVVLNGKQNTDDKTEYSATITSLSSAVNLHSNNWNEYVFYVSGHYLYDSEIQLTLGLGSAESGAKGYIFYDNVTTQKVSTDDKSSGSSVNSSAKSLEMYSSTSMTIANGYFNLPSTIDANSSYPLGVSGWEYKVADSNFGGKAGIVNLQVFDQYKSNFGSPVKPSTADNTNNVLMIYNSTQDSVQSYTSTSTISLSANAYYKFNIDVYTQQSQSTSGANITLTDSNGMILAQWLDIRTSQNWKTYSLYLHNNAASQTVTVSVSYGSEGQGVYGWAYFDNCEWNSSDASKFATATASTQTKVIDLSNTEDSLYTDSFSQEGKKGGASAYHTFDALYWKNAAEEVNADSTMGIVNKENVIQACNRDVLGKSDNVLMIYNYADTHYAATNRLVVSLSASSYYKVSVWVRTAGLSQDAENQQTVDDEVVPFGANITLDKIEQSFTEIDTQDEWVEYIFFINTTDAIDFKIMLGLGAEDALTRGYAFFDELAVLSMTEDQYNLALLDYNTEALPENIINIVNTTPAESGEELPAASFGDNNLWLVIPTIIIAIAVIVAVIGFMIKRYMQSRPTKVRVAINYDRSSTLLKDVDQRNRKTAVSHRLKLLREELAQTQKYMDEEKQEYRKELEAYKTAKDIADQDKSIKLEEPSKRFTDYDKTVAQLERNITSIKTDIILLEEEQEHIQNRASRKAKESTTNKVVIKKRK